MKQKPHEAPPASRFNYKTNILILVILGIALGIARVPVIVVLNDENGIVLASTYRMDEDDFYHPRLKTLREREHLDRVVAKGSTQFEKIVLLRKWAHDQWKASDTFYYPAWDAVEILDLARRCDNRGFCAQYSIVFLQACQSLGIHARYIELPDHFVAGAWSDDYNSWVIMDPTNNIHYEKNGVPLGGRGLCNAYWNNDTQGILAVGSDGIKTKVTKKDLEVYRLYSIVEKADQLSHPPMVKINGGPMLPLERQSDYHRYPLIGRDNLTIGAPYLAWKDPAAKEYFKDTPQSDDPDEFNYVLNQTLIVVARRNKEKGLLKVILNAENTPYLENFLYKTNDRDWQSLPQVNEIAWWLNPGFNVVYARTQNKFGWKGPVSEITVYYKPNWLHWK